MKDLTVYWFKSHQKCGSGPHIAWYENESPHYWIWHSFKGLPSHITCTTRKLKALRNAIDRMLKATDRKKRG